MSDETSRWLDSELPDELRAALSSAREDDARPAQLARLRVGVENAIGSAAFSQCDWSAADAATQRGWLEPNAAKLFGGRANVAPMAWTAGAVIALGVAALAVRIGFPSAALPNQEHSSSEQPKMRASDEHARRVEAVGAAGPSAEVVQGRAIR